VFTVTLNPSLATSVSVNFATADGTAIEGTDYLATSQILTFSPGVLEQTVTVPLLDTGNSPKKIFYGQLSSPTGAAVWVARVRRRSSVRERYCELRGCSTLP
jgi:endoglucanase